MAKRMPKEIVTDTAEMSSRFGVPMTATRVGDISPTMDPAINSPAPISPNSRLPWRTCIKLPARPQNSRLRSTHSTSYQTR